MPCAYKENKSDNENHHLSGRYCPDKPATSVERFDIELIRKLYIQDLQNSAYMNLF